MDVVTFLLLVKTCAPDVAPSTAHALVATESAFNPYAIGVVGGQLDRQPANLQEAVATVKALRRDGWNFSVGLAQINVQHFARFRLDERTAFDPCANLRAMEVILSDCFTRASRQTEDAQRALRLALSCYYSGNFQTGFEHGYVRKVEMSAQRESETAPLQQARLGR